MEKNKFKFYVERSSFWAAAALIFMTLSIVFRVLGCWGLWDDRFFLLSQIVLPIASGLLFILLLSLLGKIALWTTFLPVLGGVAFFVLKALGFENHTQMLLCILLYALVAVLYCGTVFTLIPTKWLLVLVFFVPFVYHVGVEDIARLRDTVNPVTFSEGMQEMSVLCIMLSLLFTSLGMKKQFREPKPAAPAYAEPAQPAPQPAAEPWTAPAASAPAEPAFTHLPEEMPGHDPENTI